MLNLLINGITIEMHPGQELAVKDLLKEYIDKKTLRPDELVIVCDEFEDEIETIPINVMFDMEENHSTYSC